MVGRAKRMARRAKKEKRAVRPEKLMAVDELAQAIGRYRVVAMLNMWKLPAAALQKIKQQLADSAAISVTKKSTLCFALRAAGKERLLEAIPAQPGLLLTAMNPFKLYKFLATNKSPAPAKAGDIAPHDIEVRAGPTDLAPGPAISTLTKVGIPAKVEAGKIAVMKDKVVCKAGEKVSSELAAALQLLKLEPMEIGLDIAAVWEADFIYTKDVLAVDETKLLADISLAATQAVNLSVNAGWPTAQTVPIMITKAFTRAKALGTEANILDKGIIEELLAKAKLQAALLSAQLKI